MIRKSFLPSACLMFVVVCCFASVVGAQGKPAVPCTTPGISFWKLLDAVSVGYTDGRLSVNTLYAVCLPTPTRATTSNYPYDPDAGGKLSTHVKRADGTTLNTYVWYAESIGGLWEMSRYKVIGGAAAVKPLGAGNYVLEFTVEDKPFNRFPFSVVEMKSDDPYQPPGTRYFIEGAWNDYGNIFYGRNDPQSSLRFTTWVQEKIGHEAKRSVPYEVKLVRERDGRVLGTETATMRLEPRWLKADLSFQPSDGEKNSYLKAAAVLAEDGAYSVRFTLDGKPYGKYPFTVKGGQIQLQGRQVRDATDPSLYITDYLSGGRYTSWWIKREASGR